MAAGGFTAIQYDFGRGIVGIAMAPVVFVLLILVSRLVLEALVATFRIAENTTRLVELNENR
jgi:hypothetical protein